MLRDIARTVCKHPRTLIIPNILPYSYYIVTSRKYLDLILLYGHLCRTRGLTGRVTMWYCRDLSEVNSIQVEKCGKNARHNYNRSGLYYVDDARFPRLRNWVPNIFRMTPGVRSRDWNSVVNRWSKINFIPAVLKCSRQIVFQTPFDEIFTIVWVMRRHFVGPIELSNILSATISKVRRRRVGLYDKR